MKTVYGMTAVVLLSATLLQGCKLSGEVEGLNPVEEGNATVPLQLQEITSGEIITLSDNGTFEFKHDYQPGDNFRVVVYPDSYEPESARGCAIDRGKGVFMEEDILDVQVRCRYLGVCPPVIEAPVCVTKLEPAACEQEPCPPTEIYQTGGECSSPIEGKEVILNRACGEQEGQTVNYARLIANTTTLDKGERVDSNKVYIEDNMLFVEAQYSGCAPARNFSLYVEGEFQPGETSRDGITSVKAAFINHGAGICQAYFVEPIAINLTPLKEHYKRTFNTDAGSVRLDIHFPSTKIEPTPRPSQPVIAETTFHIVYEFDEN